MNFKKPCNISNARWNSRSIYCLKAFIINLDRTEIMIEACNFISYVWSNCWFTCRNQKIAFWEPLEYCLGPVISPKYPKAYCCLMKHWNKTILFMDISFTNEICERSLALMDNVPTSKNLKNLKNRVLTKFNNYV
ncbi:hypothetical protein A3Q56_06997 [Intoshia linei]|uniref:Uncharacterized protein n=1 Tax=Intoshia linei TaxID=1819745 RepID=A0A177AUR4_9BILA|nr:hypothetical protein A3Q56_06997 [Intoshia linei]